MRIIQATTGRANLPVSLESESTSATKGANLPLSRKDEAPEYDVLGL